MFLGKIHFYIMNKVLSVFVLLTLSIVFCTSAIAQVLPGDVDDTGKVNINDVAVLIDYLLTQDASEINLDNADVNGDEMINISDVVELIDMVLLGVTPSGNEHEYVDLGLSSGTLWATCNVGANKPEEYGSYFAWGETTPKDEYNWSTYIWCNGSGTSMTKYCDDGYYGTVDNKIELDLEDDAAYVNWGPAWRMPTNSELNELFSLSCVWTQINGVSGYLITGPNGNTLFMPAAGYSSNTSNYYQGTYGYYWSNVLALVNSRAMDVYIYSKNGGDGVAMNYTFLRYYGCSVRAVRMSQE